MARSGCLSDLCLWILLRMDCSAIVVPEFGLNAYCVGEMILLLVRCFIIWSLMIVSNIFAIMGRSEIGL